ncbi:MAG TPA: enoyl-CoA hydratase-related protein [Acidimicrobiales bacterium]|nr:enoyl-CoA hydratase-related protein [Acidimicrobiales bacterium]
MSAPAAPGPYAGCAGLRVAPGDDGVLRLVMDKPAKRNALDDEMVAALIAAVDASERDESVRAILISGEGDHFCGGFDIFTRNADRGAPKPRAGSIQRRLPAQAHRLVPLLVSVQVPIVCAVRGWAAGIGLHMALACDFTVAADDARFWEPFIERGFTPDSGGTWLLPRRVGDVRAREMLLLGRSVSGREAVEWGLVHRAVPAADVTAEAEALAAQLAAGPTVAIGLTKWLLHRGAALPLDAHLRDEAFGVELSSRSEDFREGLAAFSEKRPPRFTGR